MKSGYWEKKKICGRKPQRRTDHILAVSGNLLILHGGFGDNDHFHDTWALHHRRESVAKKGPFREFLIS